MPPTPTCNICVSPFTAKVRKEVACPYCQHAACLDCIKKYLLSRPEDPHCMSCKRAWNREFLDSHLSMAFRKGELRTHREDVLLDREKARIPLLQPRIEARTAAQECNQKITDLDMKIRALDMKITAIRNEQANFIHRRTRFMRIVEGLAPADAAQDEEKTRKQFVQKCTVDGCRGFLSSAWKCGVCATWVCPDCLVPKGKEKDAAHTCNEDTKATAALIKKDTKPCPKCGMAITKVDGCDQMWCTVCQTPFSWKTGQQVFGVVHNPHYYAWLRAQNGGEAPRVPGDIPCGGLVYFNTLDRTLKKTAEKTKFTRICEAIHRVATEIYDMLPGYPRPDQVPDNGDLGVQYAFKDIDEALWKTNLVVRETKREKGLELRAVLDLFVNVCSEALRRIAEPATTPEEIGTLIQQIYELRTYVNQAFTTIGVRYGGMMPRISDAWRVDLYGSNRKGDRSQVEKRETKFTLDRDKLVKGQIKTLDEHILPYCYPIEYGKTGHGAVYVYGDDYAGRYYGGGYRSEAVKEVLKILKVRTAQEVMEDAAAEAAQKVLKERAAAAAPATAPAAGGGAPVPTIPRLPPPPAPARQSLMELAEAAFPAAAAARKAAAAGGGGGAAPQTEEEATDAAIAAIIAADFTEAAQQRRVARAAAAAAAPNFTREQLNQVIAAEDALTLTVREQREPTLAEVQAYNQAISIAPTEDDKRALRREVRDVRVTQTHAEITTAALTAGAAAAAAPATGNRFLTALAAAPVTGNRILMALATGAAAGAAADAAAGAAADAAAGAAADAAAAPTPAVAPAPAAPAPLTPGQRRRNAERAAATAHLTALATAADALGERALAAVDTLLANPPQPQPPPPTAVQPTTPPPQPTTEATPTTPPVTVRRQRAAAAAAARMAAQPKPS